MKDKEQNLINREEIINKKENIISEYEICNKKLLSIEERVQKIKQILDTI